MLLTTELPIYSTKLRALASMKLRGSGLQWRRGHHGHQEAAGGRPGGYTERTCLPIIHAPTALRYTAP